VEEVFWSTIRDRWEYISRAEDREVIENIRICVERWHLIESESLIGRPKESREQIITEASPWNLKKKRKRS